jgi:hypothetical protein
MAHVLEPLKAAWQQLGTQIKDQLIDLVVTGKASWKEMADSLLLRVMINAIVQMVIRWVAAQRVMQHGRHVAAR